MTVDTKTRDAAHDFGHKRRKHRSGPYVDREPLLAYLGSSSRSIDVSLYSLYSYHGVSQNVIKKLKARNNTRLCVSEVDEVLTAIGRPELLNFLYPHLEGEYGALS